MFFSTNRFSLATKFAILATLFFSISGILVLCALLTLAASSPLTPIDIVWLMACCAAITVPCFYYICTKLCQRQVSDPLEALVQTATNLGSAPLPPNLSKEKELEALTMALARSGEFFNRRMQNATERRSYFEALFKNMPGYVSVVDTSFTIVHANSAFMETFAIAEGRSCRHVCTREFPGGNCPVAHVFSDQKPVTVMEPGVYPDGTAALWLVSVSPVFDANGKLTAAIEARIDISEVPEQAPDCRSEV
ncbi:MAG: PAS domain-containing protein [Desulfovibrionales bacterium]|nr:PAS domain-containing protein [Desulfovibrionales bacterium]